MKNNHAEAEFEAVLKRGVVVNAFNSITNNSTIGNNTTLNSYNLITDSTIGKNCNLTSSTIEASQILNLVKIGPNAHLRPESKISSKVKIGNFVEIKKSSIGENTKISHMSYVGDAEVGKGCNIGCGVIFCNYDGILKHKTIVKDGVFIGSNVNLVAPITLEKNSLVAAGSTLTQNVEENALAIARGRQTNKPDYKKNKQNKQRK